MVPRVPRLLLEVISVTRGDMTELTLERSGNRRCHDSALAPGKLRSRK